MIRPPCKLHTVRVVGMGFGPVAYSPHGLPPAPMPRRSSPGGDARHRALDVMLGFAEYGLFFAIYISLSFSFFVP